MIRRSATPVGTACLAVALIAAACSGDGEPVAAPDLDGTSTTELSEEPAPDPESDESDQVGADPGGFVGEVRPSAEQVVVIAAEPGAALTLSGPTVSVDASADELGNLIFRDVAAGTGYTVTGAGGESESFDVRALTDHPDDEFYAVQTLDEGFGYIETRDGTLLSVMVRLPGPAESGPYPTVVEYSGYTPSDPAEPQPAMGLAAQLGYATVGVNMRGTGCSGGAFDYFEPLQSLDGYDAIEVISRQPWVEGDQVGMVGLSYPGISQLFVAQHSPPGLKAITPMSVIEDTYRSTLYPGGILNVGFARSWAEDRQAAALPLAAEFAQSRVDAGDQVCADNQLLRSQTLDLEATVRENEFYVPEVGDLIAPRTFVGQIDVPVFLAGQWQDEQTGGRFATMLDEFTGTDVLRVHVGNGAHADGFGPTVLQRWAEFLDFYVKEQIPEIDAGLRAAAPLLYQAVFDIPLELPPDRFGEFSDYQEALAAYEAEPSVLLLIESGGDLGQLGGPAPRSTVMFDAWPPPAAQMISWFLDDTRLTTADGPSRLDEPVTYVPDPDEGSVIMTPRNESAGFADLDWPHPPETGSVSWTSDPLSDDMLLAGTGLVELDITTVAHDIDIEVTVSEIRADGTEVYVQSGWLRASHRALDIRQGQLHEPLHTHLEQDAAEINGEVSLIIEILPAAHPFRAGSRIRLTIDTPGGTRPEWAFEVVGTTDPVSITAGILSLPMVVGVPLPDGYPACSPGLRSQPCRPAA